MPVPDKLPASPVYVRGPSFHTAVPPPAVTTPSRGGYIEVIQPFLYPVYAVVVMVGAGRLWNSLA